MPLTKWYFCKNGFIVDINFILYFKSQADCSMVKFVIHRDFSVMMITFMMNTFMMNTVMLSTFMLNNIIITEHCDYTRIFHLIVKFCFFQGIPDRLLVLPDSKFPDVINAYGNLFIFVHCSLSCYIALVVRIEQA